MNRYRRHLYANWLIQALVWTAGLALGYVLVMELGIH